MIRQDRVEIVTDLKESRTDINTLNLDTALMASNVTNLQHVVANVKQKIKKKIHHHLNDSKREKWDDGV